MVVSHSRGVEAARRTISTTWLDQSVSIAHTEWQSFSRRFVVYVVRFAGNVASTHRLICRGAGAGGYGGEPERAGAEHNSRIHCLSEPPLSRNNARRYLVDCNCSQSRGAERVYEWWLKEESGQALMTFAYQISVRHARMRARINIRLRSIKSAPYCSLLEQLYPDMDRVLIRHVGRQ